MWKYVSRRIRDTFEKGANYFDIRSTTGVANNTRNNEPKPSPPCRWFSPRKCRGSYEEYNDTNGKQWSFDTLNRSWLEAITWSGALVIGWYTSNLIHLKYKYCRQDKRNCPQLYDIVGSVKPFLKHDFKNAHYFENGPSLAKVVEAFVPTVHLIADDKSGAKKDSAHSGSTSSSGASNRDLSEVLNSIENKLGLTAIENGQHQEGLNLLKSAANRNHAPALYNLALCYESGIGVPADEKMAMELYRSAAALEHPSAMYNLGIYYGQGRGGLTRNTETATRLLRLAALKGHEDATKALKSLEIPTFEDAPIPEVWNYSHVPYTQNNDVMTRDVNGMMRNPQINIIAAMY